MTIAEVARMLEMNPSFISREFKTKTNTNYLKYLTTVRINKAKELLLTDMPIDEIVTSCGYLDKTAFSRVFKQYTGMPITFWIKQNKK